jgi:hypothetical protein
VRGSATSFKEQFEKLRSAKSLNSKRNWNWRSGSETHPYNRNGYIDFGV